MFVYIIIAKIELFESGAYLHSNPTTEQLYNICACTSFKRINYLDMYYDSPNHVFDAIHIESNRKPKVNHYLIHSCPLNSQALSRDLGDKKYPCPEEMILFDLLYLNFL